MDNSVISGKAKSTKTKIHINPANKGKLHAALGVKEGSKIPVAKMQAMKANGTPAQKKMAKFAINARKWSK